MSWVFKLYCRYSRKNQDVLLNAGPDKPMIPQHSLIFMVNPILLAPGDAETCQKHPLPSRSWLYFWLRASPRSFRLEGALGDPRGLHGWYWILGHTGDFNWIGKRPYFSLTLHRTSSFKKPGNKPAEPLSSTWPQGEEGSVPSPASGNDGKSNQPQ